MERDDLLVTLYQIDSELVPGHLDINCQTHILPQSWQMGAKLVLPPVHVGNTQVKRVLRYHDVQRSKFGKLVQEIVHLM